MRIRAIVFALVASVLGFAGSSATAVADGSSGGINWVSGNPWNTTGGPVGGPVVTKKTELKPVFHNDGPTNREIQIVLASKAQVKTWGTWHARYGWSNVLQKLSGRVLADVVVASHTVSQQVDRVVSNVNQPFIIVLSRDTTSTATWGNWFDGFNTTVGSWQVVAVGQLVKNSGATIADDLDVRTNVHGVTVTNSTGIAYTKFELDFVGGHVQKGNVNVPASGSSVEFLPDTKGVPFVAKFMTSNGLTTFTVGDQLTWDGFNLLTVELVPPPTAKMQVGSGFPGVTFGKVKFFYSGGTSQTATVDANGVVVLDHPDTPFTLQFIVTASSDSNVLVGSLFTFRTESPTDVDNPVTTGVNEATDVDPADPMTVFNGVPLGETFSAIAGGTN